MTMYQRGLSRLQQVDAEAGERVIASLAGVAPDLGSYIIEFAFGEVYCRPGLTLAQRELATIAALTAMGTAEPQLKVHIAAGLNVGLSQQEIIETMLQMAVYAGFPAALNGVFAAKTVFAEHESIAAAPVCITAELHVLDATRVNEAVTALSALASATRLEVGCVDFRVQHDVNQPQRLILWEHFRDDAAFGQHFHEAHTLAYLALNLTEVVQFWQSQPLKN